MKTLGLIVVLGIGVLAMLLAIVPVGTSVTTTIYPERAQTVLGLLRVGEVTVHNDGLFTRAIKLPELVACVGADEVQLDSYVATGGGVVRGMGQLSMISVKPGDTGTIYLVARTTDKGDHFIVYHRTSNFSCLTAKEPLN